MMVYNIPILVPIWRISEIWATHGVITEMNAPEKNPYARANRMTTTNDLENIQNTRHATPEKKADGMRMLKRPMISERYAGAIRPKNPPAFITART
jgi:hypothetical protein